ncbi:hypothetical protein ANCCEY_13455 [Ancylostoma ceylanicum]|uniref:ELMO armadillo-like helical domain-containing protein n=1 Tax=Ancylostoma ceylanicum TaxID=53326 RepID=A0A0D6LCA0_9BILA|nr:hypothetical protein ANCCEY_13455 [Ancylostoma ceylanicum]
MSLTLPASPQGLLDVINLDLEIFENHSVQNLGMNVSNISRSTPLLLLSDVLHEDPRTFAALISKTGVARYMTDLLASIEMDWTALSRGEPEAVRSLALFKSLMIALTRLSLTESGWNALAELALPEVLAQLQMLSHPPKQVFLQPTSIKEKDTPGELYVSSFELILHLCIAICAKPKWKRLSFKILDVVHSQGELLNQLMRAEIQCRMVDYATTLVQYIWENDDTTRLVIDGDSMLNQLRARPHGADTTQKCAKKPYSFVIPSRLSAGTTGQPRSYSLRQINWRMVCAAPLRLKKRDGTRGEAAVKHAPCEYVD